MPIPATTKGQKRGWHCGIQQSRCLRCQQATWMPTSDAAPCYWPEKSSGWPKHRVPCHPSGRRRWSSWLQVNMNLASSAVWKISSRQKILLCLSVSIILTFKNEETRKWIKSIKYISKTIRPSPGLDMLILYNNWITQSRQPNNLNCWCSE